MGLSAIVVVVPPKVSGLSVIVVVVPPKVSGFERGSGGGPAGGQLV